GTHPLRLAEPLAYGVERSRVGRRVAPPRAADRALVDRHHPRAGGDRPVNQRALAGGGAPGADAQHPGRDVDVDVLEVVRGRPADLERAGGRPHRLLEGGPVTEMAAGEGGAGPQRLDGALDAG